MNQTKKRLQIINIAISITDIETIQLQMLKLATLRKDEKLQEILAGLQAQNYAQTQALITKYIETPTEEIVQRTSQQEEQEIIDQFDLFVTAPETPPAEEETELFDFNTLIEETAEAEEKKETPRNAQSVDFDNLLNLTAEDVMPENIGIDISHTPEDDFFNTSAKEGMATKESHIDTDTIPKDDFFDTPETKEPGTDVEEDIEEEELFSSLTEEIQPEEEAQKEETHEEILPEEVAAEEEAVPAPEPKREALTSDYKNIPYIDQKLKNMLTQYPPLLASNESYDSVNNWLLKIANEGYSEAEVEEVIAHVAKLKEKNAIAEAAQLLLICGATESKFAQFMLARELFRGDLLEKNLPEAFTLINRLAMDDDYPEAICDLAQFYEKGVGIDKDKKRAEALYKEAMEAGVKRAKAHYQRLSESNKGLLGKLFGKR